MINQYFEIARLIAKQISGELDKEEQIRLENWRKESPENERLFEEIRNEETLPPTYADAIHSTQTWVGRR